MPLSGNSPTLGSRPPAGWAGRLPLGSALGGILRGKDSMDIDAYVTNKALDRLFKMVAEVEQQIRQNPAARTTAVLQKVFGTLKK